MTAETEAAAIEAEAQRLGVTVLQRIRTNAGEWIVQCHRSEKSWHPFIVWRAFVLDGKASFHWGMYGKTLAESDGDFSDRIEAYI